MAAKKKEQDGESEVWSAIAAFEQILEAIPNDRTSIETLAHAYEQIGDLTKAREYLVRLADVVIGEADQEAAQEVQSRLKAHADDEEAKSALERLDGFLATASPMPDMPKEKPTETTEAVKPATGAAAGGEGGAFSITNELSFAWNLLQANELTQDEYSSVVQDLTDMSGTDAAVTVSVLHVLNDRGFKNMGRIMAAVGKDCGTPVISLAGFKVQRDVAGLLPLNFAVTHGVLPFDKLGDDALVVILNPYDSQLMNEVKTMTGCGCHFYLAHPSEFDAAIQKLSQPEEEEED